MKIEIIDINEMPIRGGHKKYKGIIDDILFQLAEGKAIRFSSTIDENIKIGGLSTAIRKHVKQMNLREIITLKRDGFLYVSWAQHEKLTTTSLNITGRELDPEDATRIVPMELLRDMHGDPKLLKEAGQRLLGGASVRQVAYATGLDKNTVNKIKKRVVDGKEGWKPSPPSLAEKET